MSGEVADQWFQTFVEQRDGGQVLLPVSESVAVESSADVSWDGRDVRVDGSPIQIDTEVLLFIVEGIVGQATVSEAGADLLGLAQCQLGVSGSENR